MNKKIEKLKKERDWVSKKVNDPFFAALRKAGKGKGIAKIYADSLSFYDKKILKQEAKNVLIGRQEEYLDLSGSREEMPDKDLLIKDNPNLETLIIDNCLLEKIKVVNCPKLKTLSCRHNYRITEIDISECPSLEGLYCSNNKITSLDLSKNLNLKHLVCDNNSITELNVNHLTNLEELYCFKCRLKELDCSGMEKLKELFVAHQNEGRKKGLLEELLVQGCKELKELDCAENNIKKLDLSNLKDLIFVSLYLNHFDQEVDASNCVNLEYLDARSHLRSKKELIFERLKNKVLKVEIKGCINLKSLFAHESILKIIDLNDFPSLKLLYFSESGEADIEKEKNKQEVKKKRGEILKNRRRENPKRPSVFKQIIIKENDTVAPEPFFNQSSNNQQSFNQSINKDKNNTISQSNQFINYTPYLIGGEILVLGLLSVFSLSKFKPKKRKKN